MTRRSTEFCLQSIRRFLTGLALFVAIMIPFKVYTDVVAHGDALQAYRLAVETALQAVGLLAFGRWSTDWLRTRLCH